MIMKLSLEYVFVFAMEHFHHSQSGTGFLAQDNSPHRCIVQPKPKTEEREMPLIGGQLDG